MKWKKKTRREAIFFPEKGEIERQAAAPRSTATLSLFPSLRDDLEEPLAILCAASVSPWGAKQRRLRVRVIFEELGIHYRGLRGRRRRTATTAWVELSTFFSAPCLPSPGTMSGKTRRRQSEPRAPCAGVRIRRERGATSPRARGKGTTTIGLEAAVSFTVRCSSSSTSTSFQNQNQTKRRPTFRLGFGRGGQSSLSSYASGSSSWTLELGSRAPLRFSEVLSFDQSGGASGLGFSDNASSSSQSLTTFSDEAFVRNGVAPSAIGYDASLPRPGCPLRLNTPRYAADEASVKAILSLLAPEHGEAMRKAGEELDAAMVARWLQPRAGDAQATLRALRAHVAWRTDPRGPFLTSSSCDSSFSVSSSRASSSSAPPSSAPATPRDTRMRSGSGKGDGVEGNGISGDGGPSLPPRGSSASGSGDGGRAPPRRRGRRGGSEKGSERGAGGGLLPAAGAGRVDPRSIPTCLAARKACLQGVDRAGRAVVLIRASRHFMGAGSTVEDNQRLMALVLDAAFAAADAGRNPARRLLCLFDLKGLRLANCDVK